MHFDNRAGGNAVAVPTAIGVHLTPDTGITSGRDGLRSHLAGTIAQRQAVDLHGRQQDDHNPSHDHEMATEHAQQDVPGTGHEALGGETVELSYTYRVLLPRQAPPDESWGQADHDGSRFRFVPAMPARRGQTAGSLICCAIARMMIDPSDCYSMCIAP